MSQDLKFQKVVTSSQILFAEAQKLDLNPRWETDYGLFSVELPNPQAKKNTSTTRQFFFHTNLNLNGERARFLSKNKHFTRLVLAEAGFKNIPFCLPASRLELEKFFDKHQPIICKPLLGQQSKSIKLISTKNQLNDCSLHLTFFEKFIKGVEYRCLILQNEVIAVQRKELKTTKKSPWQLFYINLKSEKWDKKLMTEAKKIAQVFNLNWAGIDFIVEADGSFWILEVNSAPGIVKIHHPDEGAGVNAANKVWKAVMKNLKVAQE
jgi:D-alanine-D-alanine ligase-like ATP-grasp enzyme